MPLCQVPLWDKSERFLIVPVTTQDKRGLKKESLPYLDDSIGVGEEREAYLGNTDYAGKYWGFLFRHFFRVQEKWTVCRKLTSCGRMNT